MDDGQFAITWHDSGREPQCPPNPAYPSGIDLDAAFDLERSRVVGAPGGGNAHAQAAAAAHDEVMAATRRRVGQRGFARWHPLNCSSLGSTH